MNSKRFKVVILVFIIFHKQWTGCGQTHGFFKDVFWGTFLVYAYSNCTMRDCFIINVAIQTTQQLHTYNLIYLREPVDVKIDIFSPINHTLFPLQRLFMLDVACIYKFAHLHLG